jgi:hypothetical protein
MRSRKMFITKAYKKAKNWLWVTQVISKVKMFVWRLRPTVGIMKRNFLD